MSGMRDGAIGRAKNRPVAADFFNDTEDESEEERARDEEKAKLILDSLKPELKERALKILRRIEDGKAVKKGDIKGDDSNEGSDTRVNEWNQVEVFAPVVAAAWHSKAARKSATAWQCIPVIPREYAQVASSRASKSHQSSDPALQPRAQPHAASSERDVRDVSPLFVPKGPPSPQTSNRRVPSTRSVLERRRTSAIPGPQNTTRSVREELRTQGLNPQQIETVIQQVGSTVGETGQTQQNTKPVQMEMGSRITSLNTSRQGIREYERRVSQPDNIAARREETNKSLRRRRPTVEAEKHASRPVDLGHKAASREASRASQPATPEKRKVKGAHVRTDTGSIFIRGLDLDDDEDDDEELEKGSPRKKIKSSEQALREAKVIIRKEQADEKRAAEKEAFEATLFPAHAPPPKLFAAPRDLREQGFEETSRGQKGQVHRSFDPSLTNPIDRHQRTINRTDMVGNWGPERKPLSWEERLEFQRNRDAQRSRQPAPQHVDNNPGPASISTGHQAISTTHTTEHGVAAAHHQGPGGSRDSGNHQASQGPHADLSIQLPRDSRSSRALLSHREPRTPQQQGPISNIARAPRLSGRPQPDMFANQEDENRLLPDSPPSAHRHPIHPLQRIQQQLRTSAGIRDTRPVGRTQTPNTNASARQDNQTRPTLLSPPRFVSGSTWPGQGLQERGERGTRGRGDTRNTRMRAATEQSQAQAQAQAQAQMRFGPSAAPPLAPPRGPGGVQIVSPPPVSPSVPAPTPKADWKVSKWMAEYQAEAEHDPLSRFYEK